MPSHPLLNFEIERYYRIENRFDNVYSRNNLPEKIKDGAYAVNLDEYAGVGTHWLLYFVTEVRFFFFSIALVLNTFLKRLKYLSGIKSSKLTFFEYKQTIQ